MSNRQVASKGRKMFRRSVFIQLLMSFMCILLIPVLIGLLLYNEMEQAMIDNANESNQALLEQARLSIDSRMNEVEQLAVQVGLNPTLQLLLYGEENKENFDEYKYVELINGFKRYRNVSPIIDDYYVYIRDTGHILTTSVKTDSRMFFNYMTKYANRTEKDMADQLSRYHLRTYMAAEPVKYSLKQKNMITYVKSLPLGESRDTKGALVVMIDETSILGLLRKEANRHADYYILNEQGEVLTATAPRNGLMHSLLPKFGGTQGDFEAVVDGESMMISYTRSEPNNWTYVSMLPKGVVLSKVNETKSLALMLMLVCIVAGVTVSYYLAYKNHRPIRELIHTILNGKNMREVDIRNEFAFIRSELMTSMDGERNMRGLLTKQAPVIQADFIARMIKGYVDTKALSERDFDFMDVHFRHAGFGVIVLQIDDCHQFIQEDTEREWTLIRFILINLSSELLGDGGYAIEMERDRVCILLNHNGTGQCRPELEGLLERLRAEVGQKFRTGMTIAVSGLGHGIETIAEAYGEAVMALDYRFIQDHGSIIYYDDIKDAEHHYFYYPMETEAQLINYAKCGDYASLSKVLDSIFKVNFETRAISPEMGRCLRYELQGTVLKLFSAMQMDEKPYLEGDRFLMKLETPEKMKIKLLQLYAAVCDKVESEKTDHSDRLFGRIEHYIRGHYDRNDISLTSIADHCGLNPSYLSTFFKKQCGQNVTEYITALRVQRAKEYLAEGGLTVTQIALRVGFANDIGLIRVFKKAEGVTPGKYKELISDGNARRQVSQS
ncbi:helix-turn-helix domain-containing protein [Paenibacillus soyae]|uniref:Helix-turn-helix domain-containing protein n=1 Tax=Paenibacillus soyae TaxID=2969249 RepID=A0A9X2SAF7_9BACL|nr:helix-turn-helix domain-containing protein [Paenibacillus soyae]MCR2806226.1 helix-turn-helix domain-containing protein [Paenibacillus soyae]